MIDDIPLDEYSHSSINFLSKAIIMDSTDSKLFNNRALAYENIGKFGKARFDYDLAIELDKNNHVYYFNRGILFMRINNYQNALLDINKALELDPNH